MLKIIIGTVDKDEILEWCFDVAKKDNSTRVALVECMEQYIRCYIHDPTKIDAMIISIIFSALRMSIGWFDELPATVWQKCWLLVIKTVLNVNFMMVRLTLLIMLENIC